MELVLPLIKEVMSSPVHTIQADQPVGAALAAMDAHGVRRLPVLDADEALVGILTLAEASKAAGPAGLQAAEPTVKSAMRTPVHTVKGGDLLDRAITLMRLHKVGALPVVQYGTLVGVVSESDVFRWLADLLDLDGQASWQ